MAASSSAANPILCASFNQDNSCFVIGTKDGFRIFDSSTGRLLYERVIGAFVIVEMLFSSSLLVIVGAGEQASLSPRRLCLFNTKTGIPLRELNFLTSILAVCVNRKRLIVVLQGKTFIYDINSLVILDTIDTVPNLKGLCAFSPCLDGCFLALPASTTNGSVLVYNVMDLHSHCEIDAHRSPLAAMVFSSNGMYIATASEQGTIIRVHSVSDATKSYSFRRGTYPSTVYSLSFGPSRRSNTFLGSIIPDSVSDALDAAHHHVLHNAVQPGIRSFYHSYVVIRKVDKVADTSASESPACRVKSSLSMLARVRSSLFSIRFHAHRSSLLLPRWSRLSLLPLGQASSIVAHDPPPFSLVAQVLPHAAARKVFLIESYTSLRLTLTLASG
ncbi:WD40 repeat-containing protein [Cynara cardunculus var. scolymus]|uniref:WD40 repeat-containing protein n=1 Tax=Cynara cardunculus var. scolymus TaxID=59895 RepID=A0A103Y2K3_CYNCS|nr:WD40 repeat-containing protein [Cynara cardunculus var. scolymus]